ncbi:MAG: DUF6505 family protein [Variibacter sp.]
MKLLRTIALDPSDTFVFDPVAEPGEWAVSGAFRFWDGDPATLEGKARSAFRSGFLGVPSWGWSTLVQIVEARAEDRAAVVELLAQQLVDKLGAPDRVTARQAAEEEVAFVQSLCDHPKNTLIAVHRTAENGEVREAFRTLQPRNGPKPWRVFSFKDAEDEEEPAEHVDLLRMIDAGTGRERT